MPKIWLSTLQKLPSKLGIDEKSFQQQFSRFANEGKVFHDALVNISVNEKIWLEFYLQKLSYPSCSTCSQQICGNTKSHCRCQGPHQLQEEYDSLISEIRKAEAALGSLINAPFRQSRNAFGFASSIFGGTNLLLSSIPKLSLAVTCTLLVAPAAILGLYVYARGKHEEQKINADFEAELMDRKINLLLNHRELVMLRHQQMQTSPEIKQKLLQDVLTVKPKPHKEKRHPLGNPLSHFIVGSLATMGLAFTAIKWGVLGALIAGGPITWVIAGILSLAVGGYFGYKRYKHLAAKVALEKQLACLASKEAEIISLTKDLKAQNHQNTLLPTPEPAHGTKLMRSRSLNLVTKLSSSAPAAEAPLKSSSSYPSFFPRVSENDGSLVNAKQKPPSQSNTSDQSCSLSKKI